MLYAYFRYLAERRAAARSLRELRKNGWRCVWMGRCRGWFL